MPTVSRSFEIDAPIEETWDFLVTPDRVAPCVPGCESFDEQAPDVFDATIAVKVAYTSLQFDAHVELRDKTPPESLTLEATAEPAGSMPGSATVDADLALSAIDDSTTAGTLDIEFAIRGRLGSLGESAFTHKCEELTDTFLASVRDELEQANPLAE